jgi:hypothetical protein
MVPGVNPVTLREVLDTLRFWYPVTKPKKRLCVETSSSKLVAPAGSDQLARKDVLVMLVALFATGAFGGGDPNPAIEYNTKPAYKATILRINPLLKINYL